MDWEPIVRDKLREAKLAPAVECDCSFDVSHGAGGVLIVRALRFLDPSDEGSRYVGGPLGPLMEALGRIVAAAVQTILEAPSPELAKVVLPDTDSAFRVVTGHAVDRDTVRVTVRCIDSHL